MKHHIVPDGLEVPLERLFSRCFKGLTQGSATPGTQTDFKWHPKKYNSHTKSTL